MAKSKKTRGNTSTAKSHLRFSQSQFGITPYDLSRQTSFNFEGALRDLEDRREWHPEGPFRPARSFRSSRHRLVVAGYPKVSQSPPRGRFRNAARSSFGPAAHVTFEVPEQVAICVRRRRRREVLFARRKTGRGGQRRPRWNWYSKVRCR